MGLKLGKSSTGGHVRARPGWNYEIKAPMVNMNLCYNFKISLISRFDM